MWKGPQKAVKSIVGATYCFYTSHHRGSLPLHPLDDTCIIFIRRDVFTVVTVTVGATREREGQYVTNKFYTVIPLFSPPI